MNIDTQAANRARRAAFYLRVTPFDPDPEPQLLEIRQIVVERGYEIVTEFIEKVSATKTKRPALDRLLADARRGHFDLVIVWSCDRIARSTRHFLDLLEELYRLHIEFSSVRDGIDTGGPQGGALVQLTSALAGLERSLTSERVRAGNLDLFIRIR